MDSAAAEAARCALHPQNAAVAACSRCGTFVCGIDRREVDGAPYCEDCAVLPEVDWLEAFRRKCWGKRDPGTWLVGLGAPPTAVLAVGALVGGDVVAASCFGAAVAVQLCFFLGLSWARYALVALPAISLLVFLFSEVPAAATSAVLPLLITVSIVRDTRNQLFFKREVSRERLKKAWHLHANNQAARSGFFCGLLGVFFPPVAVVGLVCSVIGLRQVDPDARPPVGRKGQAIAGLVLNGIGVLEGLFLLAFLLRLGRFPRG